MAVASLATAAKLEAQQGQQLLEDAARFCSVELSGQVSESYDYICDTTIPWLHYDGSTYAPATPPPGTGCHHYVYLSGTLPDCSVGSSCSACASPSGTQVGQVNLDGGSCNECDA